MRISESKVAAPQPLPLRMFHLDATFEEMEELRSSIQQASAQNGSPLRQMLLSAIDTALAE